LRAHSTARRRSCHRRCGAGRAWSDCRDPRGQLGQRLVVKIGSGNVDQLRGCFLNGGDYFRMAMPVEATAMPAAKSRNSFPSASSMRIRGRAWPPADTSVCSWARSAGRRLRSRPSTSVRAMCRSTLVRTSRAALLSHFLVSSTDSLIRACSNSFKLVRIARHRYDARPRPR